MIFITNEQELIFNNDIQGIYFYSTWMPFHKKMSVMISKIEEKYKNVSFLAIDVDAFANMRKRFNIDSIPTVIIMSNGEEKKRINGLVLTSAFRSAFADICKS